MLSIGKINAITFHADSAQGYCAVNVCSYFRKVKMAEYFERFGTNRVSCVPASANNFLESCLGARDCASIYVGDRKGGIADRHIFRFFKGMDSLTFRGFEWLVSLSHYYRNPNSGNLCRHLVLTKVTE